MENALLIGMTRQMALRREMSIIANNLANINTNGFKAEKPIFEQYLSRTASEDSPNDTVSFVQDFGMHRDLREGRMEVTDNPLDVAISGEGYFKSMHRKAPAIHAMAHLSLTLRDAWSPATVTLSSQRPAQGSHLGPKTARS